LTSPASCHQQSSREIDLVFSPEQFSSFSVNGHYVRWFDIEVPAGPLPEGRYQAEVSVDGSKVALINWSVAKAATQAPTVSDADLRKDGAGDPSLTYDVVRKNPAAFRGKRVTWAFMSSSAKGNRILGALDRDAAVPPPHHGLYVVEFAADQDVGRVFRETAFAKGATVTVTCFFLDRALRQL
jgi:hypothetical protein